MDDSGCQAGHCNEEGFNRSDYDDTALLPGRYFGAYGATVLALQSHDAYGLTSPDLATKFARTQPFDRHAAVAA